MSTRVLLVDDHRMFLEGLRSLLKEVAEMEVVGVAEDGREALRLGEALRPDVILMDVAMPGLNGMDATRQIVTACPEAKVVALTSHADSRFVAGMLKAGARGFLLKSCAPAQLLVAIRAVRDGQSYLSPEVTEPVIRGCLENARPFGAEVCSGLSSREREVLQLIAEGKATREIAALLGVGEKTVETYRRRIMGKLDLRTVPDLVKYAIREGLAKLEG